jgi:hypothetical protein
MIPLFIELCSKKDVVLDGAILNPGLLRDIGCSALDGKGSDMTVIPPEMPVEG